MKRFEDIEKAALADPAVRAEFDALATEYAIARALIAARQAAGLNQAELAQRMGTTQSAISRLESGQRPPSISTLKRYAKATGQDIRITIAA